MKGLEIRIVDKRKVNDKVYFVNPTEDEYKAISKILDIKEIEPDWED
jgi:hypothetical protein